jgi:thymidine phosphorylase
MGAPRAAVELIAAKRRGLALAPGEIAQLVEGYLGDRISEAQMASWLMAVCWRGLSEAELRELTRSMAESGGRLELGSLPGPTVDKHSTGGVGDKVSLVLVPLMASLGCFVPQLSGRALGATGGTLDKLESIPGVRCELSSSEILRVVREVGCVIAAASPELAPADRHLYALRDSTATVQSLPLIASSIVSKKVAEGVQCLLFDVKVGSGALIPQPDEARRLAATLAELASGFHIRTSAMVTAMDQPLGRAVGNALEVKEALEVLAGEGPLDLRELVLEEARELLRLSGQRADPSVALDSGAARERFSAMVRAQGGAPDAPLPLGVRLATLNSPRRGFVSRLDAGAIGLAAWRLGSGRRARSETVDPVAGIVCLAKTGAEVDRGQPLLELWGRPGQDPQPALLALEHAIRVGNSPPPPRALVLEHVAGS